MQSFPDDRLTRDEAAEYLGVKASTLTVWASTGRYNLPFIKVGRRVYYRRADLDAWLDRRRRGGHNDALPETSPPMAASACGR